MDTNPAIGWVNLVANFDWSRIKSQLKYTPYNGSVPDIWLVQRPICKKVQGIFLGIFQGEMRLYAQLTVSERGMSVMRVSCVGVVYVGGVLSRHACRKAFTLVELLVVIAIIGVLVGLLLPAIQSAREAARRMSCSNNMRQLGMALHMFHDANRAFPASGWTTTGPGNPAGKFVGWRPLTLPFLEQSNAYQLYNFSSNWWEGTNLTLAAIPFPMFRCPSTPENSPVLSIIAKNPRPSLTLTLPLGPTDYEAIQGVQPASIDPVFYNSGNRFAVMHRNSRVRMGDILDGTSNTICVVECAGRPVVYRLRQVRRDLSNDQGIGWADSEGPFSLDGASADGSQEGCTPAAGCNVAMNVRNDNEPYSFHPGGIQALYADGHVDFVPQTIDIKVMAAQCTRAAGEVVTLP